MIGAAADRVGDAVLETLAAAGEYFVFAARAFVTMCRPPYEIAETFRQLYALGWRTVPLVIAAGFAIGVVFSMHTRVMLETFGAASVMPQAVAITMIRETGPLVVGLLAAGRIGAGIGAELGAMRVTEQIDAIEALGVDAFNYLVGTRLLACIVALPILTVTMDFSGLLGGFVAELVTSGMAWHLFIVQAFDLIGFADFSASILKTAVFGFLIGTVSAYLGFNTSRGTEGVGEASTRSVVASSIALILVDVLLVKLIYILFPQIALV